jgi:hypothetical protein
VVEALTVERAGELFAGLMPAPGPVRAVSRFAEGSVTGAYRIEFADADPVPVVLKIYDAGSVRFAVKEARALRFLTGHGLDISPRVLAFSRSAGPLGGRPCLVSSLRPGRTLADSSPANGPRSGARACRSTASRSLSSSTTGSGSAGSQPRCPPSTANCANSWARLPRGTGQPGGSVWGHRSWPGIGSASAAREEGAGKGSAKYWVSCVTRSPVSSMTLTEYVGMPS